MPTIAKSEQTMDRIYDFLKAYREEHGYMPVTIEIAEGLGLSSTSVVAYHLTKMELRGDIKRAPGKARAIDLTRDHVPA